MIWLASNWKALAVALVVAAACALSWNAGAERQDALWQARWESHRADDVTSTAGAQTKQRAIEQSRQQSINRVTNDAQRKIDQADSAAADARASADSLRRAADQLAAQLAASEAGRHSCTTGASQAAATAARVLADVLRRADERAGHLAEIADQARARGLACEAAYGALR